jgi:hypothetical protein
MDNLKLVAKSSMAFFLKSFHNPIELFQKSWAGAERRRSSARPANGPNSMRPVWVIIQDMIRLTMAR